MAALTLAALACTAVLPTLTLTAVPTPTDIPGAAETQAALPRITPQEAKAAFDSGQAIIVDVRSTDSFVAQHIQGALSFPLTRIEQNPGRVPFDKTKWIITYCT